MGEKKSCLAITEEYARADPVYVAKTEVSGLMLFGHQFLLNLRCRLCHKHTPTIGQSEAMAIVDGEVCEFSHFNINYFLYYQFVLTDCVFISYCVWLL